MNEAARRSRATQAGRAYREGGFWRPFGPKITGFDANNYSTGRLYDRSVLGLESDAGGIGRLREHIRFWKGAGMVVDHNPIHTIFVRLSIVLFSLMVFVITSMVSMFAWWSWGPSDPPVTYVNPDKHRAWLDGDVLVIRREVVVHRKVVVTVERELFQRQGADTTLIIDLPNGDEVLTPLEGVTTQIITRRIPLIRVPPPGVYELGTTRKYQANPIKVSELHPPTIHLEVK